MHIRDIYCGANLLLKQQGKAAKAHATLRVRELQASGDVGVDGHHRRHYGVGIE